jgi:hypothetical protein
LAPAPTSTRPTTPKTPSRLGFALKLAVAGVLAVALLFCLLLALAPRDVVQKLNDLKGANSAARQQALVWLAEAEPQDAFRAQVTAALEPMILEGDVRGDLGPDLLLRAYLHWAASDNVPAMIRMVESPNLPSWNPARTGLVMEALGRLKDERATEVLAEKLPDAVLHDQAVSALKLMGPKAEDAVMEYLFDDNPNTRLRAGQLLASYGTKPRTIAAEALRRLKSNDPDAQRGATVWYAENPPDTEAQKSVAGPLLARLLDDLSPRVNAEALQALKLWATRDCLPELTAYARRQAKVASTSEASANTAALIDVLAQFPDERAAEAIALQLENPAQRSKAEQALLKLGPNAVKAVLPYINHPDAGVQAEARSLCQLLNISADTQLRQSLTDVADASQARSRAALQSLARLRPDDANRAAVASALNTPLLDADQGVREDALNAALVWGTKDNAATLARLLASFPSEDCGRNPRTLEKISRALSSIGPGAEEAVIPLLQSPDGVVLAESFRILGEIGTDRSVPALQATAQHYGGVIYNQAYATIAKIMARK